MSLTRSPRRPLSSRPRRGISLPEIVLAMTLLVFVIGALGTLSAKTAMKSRTLDKSSARTFVLMQQSNRFSVLPYDSIPMYAPRTDDVIAGRYTYSRSVTYTQSTTGSEYRTLRVILTPRDDTAKPDTLVFQRAKTYARSPLFI